MDKYWTGTPVLARAVVVMAEWLDRPVREVRVDEWGCGYYSTRLLEGMGCRGTSWENNEAWAQTIGSPRVKVWSGDPDLAWKYACKYDMPHVVYLDAGPWPMRFRLLQAMIREEVPFLLLGHDAGNLWRKMGPEAQERCRTLGVRGVGWERPATLVMGGCDELLEKFDPIRVPVGDLT